MKEKDFDKIPFKTEERFRKRKLDTVKHINKDKKGNAFV